MSTKYLGIRVENGISDVLKSLKMLISIGITNEIIIRDKNYEINLPSIKNTYIKTNYLLQRHKTTL